MKKIVGEINGDIASIYYYAHTNDFLLTSEFIKRWGGHSSIYIARDESFENIVEYVFEFLEKQEIFDIITIEDI